MIFLFLFFGLITLYLFNMYRKAPTKAQLKIQLEEATKAGKPKPPDTTKTYWLILLIVVLLTVIGMIYLTCISNQSTKNRYAESSQSGRSSEVSVGSTVTLKDGLYFATSNSNLDKMIKYIVQDDQDALTEMTLNGERYFVPKDTTVKIVGFAGVVRFEVEVISGEFKGTRGYIEADVLENSIQ